MSAEEQPQEITIVLRKSSSKAGILVASVSADDTFAFVEEAEDEQALLSKVKDRFLSRNLGVNRVSWKTENRRK